jgi:serine/threonine protein phosphatase PrpC
VSDLGQRLGDAVAEAEAEVRRRAVRAAVARGADPVRGTAELAVLALDGERVWLAHVGTCRIYAAAAAGWQQLTVDHTLAEEEPALRHVAPAEHISTRRLGLTARVVPSIACVARQRGPFLLCTPGLRSTVAALGSAPRAATPEAAFAALLATPAPLRPGRIGEWRTAIVAGE